jgi:predicted enzyme related to lactoylglutathione lyase
MIQKGQAMSTTSTAVAKFSVEVITLPVSDVDRALRFYVDRIGFALDVDYPHIASAVGP